MKHLLPFAAVFSASSLVGFGGFYLAAQSGCAGNRLTVEEADAALTASCLVLSRVLTEKHPERLDAVIAQVCQPGRTREFIERVIARDPESKSSSEFLDLDFDVPPSPAPAPAELGDAGVMSTRGSP